MLGRNSKGKTSKDAADKRKGASSPIRVVVRCAWSGARLTVPSGDPLPPILASSTTLSDLLLRLQSSLPTSLFLHGNDDGDAITLVCLRKVVPRSRWGSTTLGSILDGDDGSAGVVLTLDLGGAGGGGGSGSREEEVANDGHRGAPAAMTMVRADDLIEGAISSAASSLNIKPVAVAPVAPSSSPPSIEPTVAPARPEPMDVVVDEIAPPVVTTMSPEEAWDVVLRSNFDSATKDCLNVLLKLIDNLLSSRPDANPKYRSIRCANPAFDKKVGRVSGGIEFLYSVGFAPRYPAFAAVGEAGTPETLELTPANEIRETLLRGRDVLARSAVRDLGMDGDDLPPPPEFPSSLFPPIVAPPSGDPPGSDFPRGPPTSSTTTTTTTTTTSSSPGFDVYKTHSYNVQSAAAGAPDPYSDRAMSTTERQLRDLQSRKDRMEREMQSTIGADRGVVAYRAGEAAPIATAACGDGGDGGGGGGKSDSSLLAARMKRIEDERRKREEGGFTTRAMRDLESMKKAKVYSHAQIRVSFPDGSHLHARFLPGENVSSVRSMIVSAFHPSLAQSLEFDLYVAPPRRLLNDAKTLAEEELVPAAKIHVSWKAGGSLAGVAPGCYIRDELFGGGNNVAVSAFPDAKPIVAAANSKGMDSSNGNGSAGAPSKEELLMQRMLGKTTGLLGGKKSSSDSDQGGGAKKNGKPKWFK